MWYQRARGFWITQCYTSVVHCIFRNFSRAVTHGVCYPWQYAVEGL